MNLKIFFSALLMLSIFSNCQAESNEVSAGKTFYRGFLIDNVYHSENDGDIHYNIRVPSDYDGSEAYALFITLSGWEGLYFQGVAENLRQEDFGPEAVKYNPKMIVVAPQLNDWGMTSARQTVALAEYLLREYSIDRKKIYINGYSGGGETLSLVMELSPELFTAVLFVSSKWDGKMEKLSAARTPLYIAIGENDSYYGSGYAKKAYSGLKNLYEKQGLKESEIDKILVLDVKNQEYFSSRGVKDQHAGGGLFAHDSEIMGWLFSK